MFRQCKKCKKLLYIDAFNKGSVGGYCAWCRLCSAKNNKKWKKENIEKYRKNKNDWAKKNIEKMRAYRLKYKFGITAADYKKLYSLQNGLCAICGNPEKAVTKDRLKIKTLAVDHNHENNRIRGLLCALCNKALGLIKEDLNVLLKMAAYINKHNSN